MPAEETIIQLKTCPVCCETLPISDFPKHKRCPGGIYTYCKKCTNIKNRASYHKFGDRRRAETRAWQKNNKEWRRNYINNKYQVIRMVIIQAYGGKCARCGFDDYRALCIDHVNGGGLKERKKLTPKGVLNKIVREKFPLDYQILCANCNQIKGNYIPVTPIKEK